MCDEPNLTAIDSHAECIRRNDDALGRVHETLLNRFAFGNRKAGMICGSLDAGSSQGVVNIFYVLPRSGIHDSQGGPPREADNGAHFFRGRIDLSDFKVQIGPIKPADDLGGTFDAELAENVT